MKVGVGEPTAAKGTEGGTDFRSGFVSFVGRPNVGKSTLMNALVGQKVAITSPKPQTTRRAIRGIVQGDNSQVIIVDTPGVHRPRTLLGERLNALVDETLSGVDVIGMCFPAGEKIGPGDRFINDSLERYPKVRKVAIVTKMDTDHKRVPEQLLAVQELRSWDAIVPVSALTRVQIDELLEVLVGLLPISAPLYPRQQLRDEDTEQSVAELIREAALASAREELPHSLAVTVDDMVEQEDKDVLIIYASIVVERDSQKGIVIGSGGSRLGQIRVFARPGIESLLGRKVSLSLHVRVAKDWQRDPKQLSRLGF